MVGLDVGPGMARADTRTSRLGCGFSVTAVEMLCIFVLLQLPYT
jgi:hypothetical protein